jgi:hypothetical protein
MGTVAAGALVVGTSLLVVFALATQALDYQLESSLNELENSNEPPPSMRFTKVQNIEEAVVEITVQTSGVAQACSSSPCQLRLGTGGTLPAVGAFSATFLLNAGEVDPATVIITNHGSYLYNDVSALSLFVSNSQSVTTAPTFLVDVQTIVYANVTNVGVTNIDTSEAWVTVDGDEVFQFDDLLNFEDGPTNQLTINSSDPFPIMYPVEVFTIQHLTGGSIAKERITLVSDGVIAASEI